MRRMTEVSAGAGRVGLVRGEWQRVLVLVLVALVSALLVADYSRVPSDPVVVGEVATRTIKAPFAFTYQDDEAVAEAREAAGREARPVFLYRESLLTELAGRVEASFHAARAALGIVEGGAERRPQVNEELLGRTAETFVRDLAVPLQPEEVLPIVAAGMPREAEQLVVAWLVAAYGDTLVLADRGRLPDDGRALTVVPQVGDRETFQVAGDERIRVTDDVRREITLSSLRARGTQPWVEAAEAITLALVVPNFFFDAERTEAAQSQAQSDVMPSPVRVQRGETLFREGDPITLTHASKYAALQASRNDHSLLAEVTSAFAFFGLVLGALYTMSRSAFRDDPDDTRDLATVGLVLVIVAVMARVVVAASTGVAQMIGNEAQPSAFWFVTPVAAGAMLVRVLMNRRRALFYTVGACTITVLMMQLEAMYFLYFLLTCAVAVASLDQFRERIAVLRAGAITGGFGAVVVLLMHFVQLFVGAGELSLAVQIQPLWWMLFAFFGATISSVLVLAFLPAFERLGFVTDHRMLELASLNHPLMRQLMLRAPGTYHHSVVVGTLAEAACEAIGANSLQAKIAAYFHDIGKVLKPQYFVENQRGLANRHNELSPEASARVILDHVTEGARMAREHNLPKPILDNIQMHHGTGLLQYFFAKAQMEADDPGAVDEALFRYPGPKPNTREAGVVMLADKVEAATRTIKVPTEATIRAMINRIINSVMADDQFSDCPLTFREIYTIADTFVAVLVGIYHQRIEYPQTAEISGAPGPRVVGEASAIDDHTLVSMELRAPRAKAREESWDDDLPDENTDYESVRNLPHGEP